MSSEKRSKRLSSEGDSGPGKLDDDPHRSSNYGDWICSDSECGNVNFAKRSCCNRCGKDRGECPKKKKLGQEIGKAAAEKSRGLFSADDWQCSKCGNVNWARRQQCNMCNAPKFGEVEERTGYGGGYNDRGVVEYKDRRDEDDDEYDEFGRRKKKRKLENRSDDDSKDSSRFSSPPRSRSKNSNSKRDKDEAMDGSSSEDERQSKKKEKRDKDKVKDKDKEDEHENDADEDDDDEDDDDGDLSKYDLSEWDDLVPAKKTSNGDASAISKERHSR